MRSRRRAAVVAIMAAVVLLACRADGGALPARAVSDTLARVPDRDVAAVVRMQDDGSAPLGRPVDIPAVPFSFHHAGFGFHDLTDAKLPKGPMISAPRRDTGTHDASGVRMYAVAGTLYDHPNYQANFGLENLESYRRTDDRFFLARAEKQAQRLIDTRVQSRGAWYYPYGFDFHLYHGTGRLVRAPWYSALAQGKALSLFARLATLTHEARWREAADRTFVSFLNAPSRSAPWTVGVDDENYLWLVQVPMSSLADSDLIFNGQLSAIFGLWEYIRLTHNAEALSLYDGSITTLRRYQQVLRVPGWRSTYSRTHPGSASNTYHLLHIKQLAELWLMTRRTEFVHLAEALRDDSPDPVLTTARTIDFSAGRHDGYEFDILTGKVLSHTRVSLSKATTGTTVRRMRMKGHGIYYRVKSGPLHDYWVLEQPGRTTIRGPVAELDYHANRPGVLLAGRTYYAAKHDARGDVIATTRARLPSNTVVTFAGTAWVAGARAAHVASGRLAGYWLPAAHVVFD